MAQEPDRLKQEIEQTRASLTRDVDLLAEKTSPKQVARRRLTSVKEKVMGTTDHATDGLHSAAGTVQDKASDLGDLASEKAHDVAGAVKGAPRAVTRKAQGNPLAVGLIAFGVGLLAATLMPVTDAEKQAGLQLKEHSGDLTDKAKEVVTEMKDDLTGTVREAATEVKNTATDAAQTTRDQAQSSAADVKDQSRHAVGEARS
ncbi:DUF3618 domain-containing protein [Actinoplanes sp. NPDC051494]|uniref:DUF3618 domain-containing protein n=1 Tax=Actinoplanes sp. NPDC051494 TaxID=3363907 RepID=UPI00378F6C24